MTHTTAEKLQAAAAKKRKQQTESLSPLSAKARRERRPGHMVLEEVLAKLVALDAKYAVRRTAYLDKISRLKNGPRPTLSRGDVLADLGAHGMSLDDARARVKSQMAALRAKSRVLASLALSDLGASTPEINEINEINSINSVEEEEELDVVEAE